MTKGVLRFEFNLDNLRPANWLGGNAFVSVAGVLRFKSRAGQIKHSAADGSPQLRHFFEGSCIARAQ